MIVFLNYSVNIQKGKRKIMMMKILLIFCNRLSITFCLIICYCGKLVMHTNVIVEFVQTHLVWHLLLNSSKLVLQVINLKDV